MMRLIQDPLRISKSVQTNAFYFAGILLLSGCANFPTQFFAGKPEVMDLSMLSEAQQKHYELSLHYIESAHYDVAEEKLASIIEEYPQFPDAYNALGVIHERRGRVSKGGESFLKAIELNPDFDVAVMNYGALKCYTSGATGIIEAISLRYDDRVKSRLYSTAAKCYINNHELALGQQTVDTAIALDDSYAPSYLYLAQIHYQNKQYESAKQSVDRFNDLQGYTYESAKLGLSIHRYLKDQREVTKYQHVLATQFNEEV